MAKKKSAAVSIAAEVDTIRGAVEGARVLLELHRQGGIGGEDAVGDAADILSLASVRLRDLSRTCRGTFAVKDLLAEHNMAIPGAEELVVLRGK